MAREEKEMREIIYRINQVIKEERLNIRQSVFIAFYMFGYAEWQMIVKTFGLVLSILKRGKK